MQLKYLDTLIPAEDHEFKITALSWSPNNLKLAVATSNRQILFFDETGKKRDKFSTKPANAESGKKSYMIKNIAFGPDSTKIAVAQTDSIVYVYKIGEEFGDKKTICCKFPQPEPISAMIWLSSGPIICGLIDGKIRSCQVKSNKAQSLYAMDSLVVSLAPNIKGTGFISGHADGNIIRFYTSEESTDSTEPQGRVVVHPVAPYALAWPQQGAVAAGCDKKVVMYGSTGKNLRQFDYSRDDTEYEFTVACCSPSGQAVAVGSWDRLRIYAWSPRNGTWDEAQAKLIPNMYSVTALAWKKDGSRVVCGSLTGSVHIFESVLKRTVWKDKFELTYVGPSQVLVKPLSEDGGRGVVLKSCLGREIDDVRIMGRDRYLVARTEDTLLLGDLQQNLLSEIPWPSSGRQEKFYFDNPTVCLIFNAGELSLIEYGDNNILASVRTEFANPHLISVRLNERTQSFDNKKLAYLLDLKTICIFDLITGLQHAQVTHDSKIDWMELSETSHKLLFRDKKTRLMLVDIASDSKICMHSSVNFVQWVSGSDVAVAQAGFSLLVWYNIDLADNPTTIPIRGEVIDIVREDGKTEAIAQDGQNIVSYELDEGLVEFGTAIHDNDYGRAVLFLETIGDKPEAEAMWHNLATIALGMQNLILAERCYAALGDISKTHYLHEISLIGDEYEKTTGKPAIQCPEVCVRLAILNDDLLAAESIYLEQGDVDAALDMYKKYHEWDLAIKCAERCNYAKLNDLKEEYMTYLIETGRNAKAGQILEDAGDYEEAINLFLKSNRPVRAANLVNNHPELLDNETVLTPIIKKLIQSELFEPAAEIYERLNKSELALECYRKGKNWAKTVELARIISPDRVIALEEEWADDLVETKQLDVAINHYIEAGRTRKALDAAIAAKQWKKALHIIQVIDDTESVQNYYELLAKQFATSKDYATAEKLFIKIEMYREAVDMYNTAGQWEKAHSIASKYLDQTDVSDMYIKQAETLEASGKYREAEKLYLSISEPDLAIAMYKKHDQYESMVRLVEKFHPDLLQTTHLHLGQQLETLGKHRAAEVHYLAADEWKTALNMYRNASMWEEAYRVAKQNGGQAAANQVAFLWARSLPIDPAIKLLNKYGLLESCIDYACETYQFEFGFQLCKNLASKAIDVHYKYAMALEDDGKFTEAEAEFILAGKPKEAVLMYTHSQDWVNALRIAETKIPEAVPEVLQAQAEQCFADKQYADYESSMLRAQVPEIIVQRYKNEGMWVDALRVCKDYLPTLLPTLQAEYARSEHSKGSTTDLETLLSRSNEWTQAGQYKQAIDCLLQVNNSIADPSIVRRALLRAADLVNKFLVDQQAAEVTKVLAPRLLEIQENTTAAQLFLSVDMMKEAIDCFIMVEDWGRARKIARELEPAYEGYVEGKYKDSLKKEGNVEQLADIDIIGALDLLAEQGQWVRCLEKAKSHSAPVLHKYVALYASQLLKDGYTLEALTLYVEYGAPATTQNFNIYTRISLEIYSMTGVQDNYNIWAQLRRVLCELETGLDRNEEVPQHIKSQYHTLLLITHFYALRAACREVQSLGVIGVKLSTALLRYTDIIPADKGFYEAGIDLRGHGRESEAFVFLNHYLDVCDAIEEGEAQLLDHSDLGQTDFPSSIPLPAELYLKDDPRTHDDIREWVLAVSMDQKIDQVLPVDERGLYESSLLQDESPCIITGYPVVGQQPVTFQKSNMLANRDAWSKLVIAAKMSPQSNIPNVLAFIENWCGPANSMIN